MSVDRLADAITSGGGLHGLTEEQAVDACFLTCSACVFDGYARASDYLLYLEDCEGAGRTAGRQCSWGAPFPCPLISLGWR